MRTLSPRQEAWRQFKANPFAVVGLCFLGFMMSACFIGPFFLVHGYAAQHFDAVNQGPSLRFWLGTDSLGRDLLVRLLYGGRISFAVGFAATGVSLIVGLFFGAFAAYTGGKVDTWMMRFADFLYALPFTILVILLSVVFGRHFILLFVAIGAVEWLTMARIVRAQVLSIKMQEFLQAAVLLGLPRYQIIWRHILPNLWGPVIVYGTLTVPAVMLLEATLSFLGLGVQPPMSSWGLLIHDGVTVMELCPWALLFPTLFFCLTLLSLNFLGEGLRDALDPQSKIETHAAT